MSRFKPRRFEVVVVGGLILGLWFVMSPVFERARNIKRSESCQSHLKQTGIAMMAYIRDYDEIHPLANRWSEGLLLYSKSDAIFHCPSAAKFGYSMNAHLNSLNMSRVNNPAMTPLIFDSSILKKFQHDTGASWPEDARHPKGNAVLFDDAHVRCAV